MTGHHEALEELLEKLKRPLTNSSTGISVENEARRVRRLVLFNVRFEFLCLPHKDPE